MSKLKTRSQQLEVVNGTRRERSDFASVTDFTSALPIVHDKGSLYVVAESVDENSRGTEMGRLVMRVIKQEHYADTTESIPTILVAAIQTANRVLFQENLKVDDDLKVRIGVSCAAIHGQTVYLAQVQPAQAYFSHQGTLERVPDYLDAEEESRRYLGDCMGSQHKIQPSVISIPFAPGDSLCLCSTNLANRIVTPEDEYGLVYCDAKTAIDHLHRMVQREGLAEAHALIVEAVPLKEGEGAFSCRDARPSVAIPSWQGRRSAAPEPVITADRRAPLASSAAMSSPRPSRGSSPRSTPSSASRLTATSSSRMSTSPETPVIRPSASQRIPDDPALRRPPERPRGIERKELTVDDPFLMPPWLKGRGAADNAPRTEAHERAAGKGVHPDEKLFWIEVPEGRPRGGGRRRTAKRERDAERERARGGRGSSPIVLNLPTMVLAGLGGLVSAVGRVAQRRAAPVRKERSRPSGFVFQRRWLIFGLIAIVLAVAVIFSLRILESRQKWDHFDSLIQQAEEKRQTALQENDRRKARTNLTEAMGLVAESRKLGLDQARVESLDRSLRADLDTVDGVVRLQSLTPVLDVKEIVGPKSDLHQVVSAANLLFLLDKSSSSIYRFDQKQGNLAVLLGRGWLVDDKPVADILTMSESDESIVALDSTSAAYVLDPNAMSWHRLPLGGNGRVTAKSIATYEGNLYLLADNPGRILKYANGQFSDPPADWLQPDSGLDVDQATSIAVDGRIFVGLRGGKIARLLKGKVETEFPVDVQPPLGNPTQIFTSPNVDHLYVVDSAEKRIIELDKDGQVLRQYRPPDGSTDFDSIRSIYADEGKNRLYVVSGSQLYSADLAS